MLCQIRRIAKVSSSPQLVNEEVVTQQLQGYHIEKCKREIREELKEYNIGRYNFTRECLKIFQSPFYHTSSRYGKIHTKSIKFLSDALYYNILIST